MMESPETLRYVSKEECILVFLTTGDKTPLGAEIQSAYITWHQLSLREKMAMDHRMKESLDDKQRGLYESLVRSFTIWDQTQDSTGAPGWRIKEDSVADVIKYIGADLLKLISSLEEIWQNSTPETSHGHQVKRVASLLQIPNLATNSCGDGECAKMSRSSSRERRRSSDERKDDRDGVRSVAADDLGLKNLCQRMFSDVEEDKQSKGPEETHVPYERLEEALEGPTQSYLQTLDSISLEKASRLRNLEDD